MFLLYTLKVIISAILCTLTFIGCQASRDVALDAKLRERRVSSYRSSRKIKYTPYNTSDKCVTSYTHVTLLTSTEPQALTEEVPLAKHDIKVFDALKTKTDSATCGRRSKKICKYVGPARPLIHGIRYWYQSVTRIPKYVNVENAFNSMSNDNKFYDTTHCTGGTGSSVGIATDYGLDGPG